MTIISYAQNHEDVVLARAFPAEQGFYIDVGASDPVAASVTKLFYDRGWQGINVEPASASLAALQAARPRDLNLGLGVSDVSGEAMFYELADAFVSSSTFLDSLADRYRDEGQDVVSGMVQLTTLAALCEEHVGDKTIDFLKIDVEGSEQTVLAGADFSRFRPRVVLVEATEPGTLIAAHEAWEPILTDGGYRFVLFDGLNRFYVREEDAELKRVLAAPVNTFDDYVAYGVERFRRETERYVRDLERTMARNKEEVSGLHDQLALVSSDVVVLNDQLSAAFAEKIDLIDEATQADAAASNARDVIAHVRAELETTRHELETVRHELDDAIAQVQQLRTELEAARHERDEARATLDVIHDSKLMRLTSGPRRVYYGLRREG